MIFMESQQRSLFLPISGCQNQFPIFLEMLKGKL